MHSFLPELDLELAISIVAYRRLVLSGSVEAKDEEGSSRSQDTEEPTLEYVAPTSSVEALDDPSGMCLMSLCMQNCKVVASW